MSKKVSDMAFEDLKVGMRVISAKGTPGEISALHPEAYGMDRHDSVSFEWDNGSSSIQCFHNLLTHTTLVD